MQKRTFQIYRYDPDKDAKPYMQTIEIELDGHERMLLDALVKLKEQDPSLSFRRSCREGVCGSDAMNINGKNGLACLTNMNTLRGDIVLKPLPGLPVIRDLIVDMTQFFKQYNSIKPYLINEDLAPDRERLQIASDIRAAHHVENDIDAMLAGGMPQCAGPVFFAIVVDHVGAHASAYFGLVAVAHGRGVHQESQIGQLALPLLDHAAVGAGQQSQHRRRAEHGAGPPVGGGQHVDPVDHECRDHVDVG